jgi:hypothetical protein
MPLLLPDGGDAMTITLNDIEKIYHSGRMELAVVYLEQLGYTFSQIIEIMDGWGQEKKD